MFLAACHPSQDASPTTSDLDPTTTSEPGTVSARLVLDSMTMSAGSTMNAHLIVENSTGADIHVDGCLSLFQLALSSEAYEPTVAWAACRQPLTVPEGESTHPLRVIARYSSCGGSGRPCASDGGTPPLPPGDYQANLYQVGEIVPPPPAITVRVT